MKNRTLLVLAAVILIIGVGASIGWKMTRRAARSVIAEMTRTQEETVELNALVTQVREMSRLETAAMRVVHVSTTTQSYKVIPNAIAGDELTLLAAGDVIAGVDLSLLQPSDVWRETDGTIVLRLPPPQILVTRVDNRESKIISRKTGMLRRADINMESRARQTAEQGIRNEAMRKGILTLASQNAEAKLAQFLSTVGARKVRFVSSGTMAPKPQL
ncbi:MAG TPA: DUF4230 domain-containing protein [Thermoanaerobaculia bacterium]|nr:DUF4230 domain-containing protein [Thermoanaerobaculia bacterium]